MSRKGVTRKEAAEKWVNSFNAVQTDMIKKLMQAYPEDWYEVTMADADGEEITYCDLLPMWGTMWSFDDSADDFWLEDLGGIEIMSKCGFRIFESEEFGYFFGIDGAGYDFYEDHWIPLYNERGLQWHDPELD